jgi:DNA-binding Lrp family transcriptional regulator
VTEFELDVTDKKIIKILQNNSRIHIADIARKIGNLTENAIRYRIEKLENEGYISNYTIRLDPKKFGKNIIAIFSFNVLPDNIKAALDYLKSLNYFTQIYLTTGNISIIAIGYFENRDEITKFITKNLKYIKVIDYNVITVLDKVKHELYAI